MPEPDLDPILDLKARPHRPRGRGFTISIAERIRAARHIPQAVVKVTSFSHGFREARDHLDYISREGKLPLEKETGEILEGQTTQRDLVAEWSNEFDSSPRSRDTANIAFSAPPGSDVEALRQAVRVTGARAFPNHEWVFAIHQDRQHPHAHMMVKMRNRNLEKKLQLRKGDLYRLREAFAEAAREQGLLLAASPRAVRGVGQKGIRLSLYHLQRRGIVPKVEKQAQEELAVEIREGRTSEKPWEGSMARRHTLEKEKYYWQAEALRQSAQDREKEDRQKLLQAAQDLEDFARSMPPSQTRRQAFIEQSIPSSHLSKDKTPEPGLDLER